MRVGLMTDVPHERVIGRIENIVQGQGEFDNAQAGAEVPAGFAD